MRRSHIGLFSKKKPCTVPETSFIRGCGLVMSLEVTLPTIRTSSSQTTKLFSLKLNSSKSSMLWSGKSDRCMERSFGFGPGILFAGTCSGCRATRLNTWRDILVIVSDTSFSMAFMASLRNGTVSFESRLWRFATSSSQVRDCRVLIVITCGSFESSSSVTSVTIFGFRCSVSIFFTTTGTLAFDCFSDCFGEFPPGLVLAFSPNEGVSIAGNPCCFFASWACMCFMIAFAMSDFVPWGGQHIIHPFFAFLIPRFRASFFNPFNVPGRQRDDIAGALRVSAAPPLFWNALSSSS
mmetsp:Transcript_13183/g.32347  ORF Transcript_13183/g.32347 Transcript_13183/m.32347 type:complete len:294 (-) Transcript_13183:385-1266(-)